MKILCSLKSRQSDAMVGDQLLLTQHLYHETMVASMLRVALLEQYI